MKCKKIIMLNSIEDKLSLPIYELVEYMNYYKLKSASIINNSYNYVNDKYDRLCYVIPCDTQVYDFLYKDKIIELIPALENIYKYKNINTVNKLIKK